MSAIVVYFNPHCTKCRIAKGEIDRSGVECEVIRYMDHPLDEEALGALVDQLEGPVSDLVRKDRRFDELGLGAADYRTREPVIDLLVDHPELMQRPVIVRDGIARIARTPESVTQAIA